MSICTINLLINYAKKEKEKEKGGDAWELDYIMTIGQQGRGRFFNFGFRSFAFLQAAVVFYPCQSEGSESWCSLGVHHPIRLACIYDRNNLREPCSMLRNLRLQILTRVRQCRNLIHSKVRLVAHGEIGSLQSLRLLCRWNTNWRAYS